MAEKRIKTGIMLIGEALVIWYGMGTPIPTNIADTIKLLVAFGAVAYTGWKNHDFTAPGCEGTGYTRMLKAEAKGVDFSGVPAEIMENIGTLPEGDEEGDEDE